MSKSYHRSAKKFDDDFEDEDVDTDSKKNQRFIRQLKRVFREDKDGDT
jgi:hypothetical protein